MGKSEILKISIEIHRAASYDELTIPEFFSSGVCSSDSISPSIAGVRNASNKNHSMVWPHKITFDQSDSWATSSKENNHHHDF